jgi:hypothetical protein
MQRYSFFPTFARKTLASVKKTKNKSVFGAVMSEND